ncbi:MAG TPA: hypothetical protein GX707_11555 [Epulopiscium sp.]|nr:hypothetical protein [Candidatus Epulonipiscium sp.]
MKRILTNVLNAMLDRSAYITINYLHDFTGKESKKVLYSFSIYIVTGRTSRGMTGMTIDDAWELQKAFRTTTLPFKLQKGSDTCCELLTVPKWACRILADDIARNILH